MLKKHAQVFEALFTASDLLVVSVAWTLSYWVRFVSGWIPVDKGIPPFPDYLRMLIFVWLIWGFVFRRFGLYRAMRGQKRFRELWLAIKANSLSVILLMAVTYLFREKSVPFSRAVFLIFFLCSTAFVVGSRGVIRSFLRNMRRRGYNLRHAIIVGSGELAQEVAQRITTHPEYGIELVGCLTREHRDATTARRVNAPYCVSSTNPAEKQELGIVGVYEDLPAILERGGIDQVIIALPLSDHDCLESVIGSVGDMMVDVRIVPDVHRFIQLGSLVEEFDGLPVVSLASTPLAGINRVMKRWLDIILGSAFLVIGIPIMLVIAALVKLTSRGPIFFSQERVGLDGQRFNIYKFRTMRLDAEADGAQFAVKGDPRVTPLGRFLRRFNLDELPQLINVVKGQMSLVGPRPERPVFIEEFKQRVPKYMLRHKVQAGMTGWAQVNGWRGNTCIERRIEHDLFYIENWSLALDLKILGLTFVNSFRDSNAY